VRDELAGLNLLTVAASNGMEIQRFALAR